MNEMNMISIDNEIFKVSCFLISGIDLKYSMYKFGRKKKNTENAINTVSAQAFHMKVKDINAAVGYSRTVGERMNRSCINSIFDIFFFLPNYAI